MAPEEVAAGVFEIAAANQVNGIRQVTVMKGRDPADYVLVAFGGAGGMFAADVADFLSIQTILSPPDPGNLSAFGLHVSDIKRDYIRTLVRQQSSADAAEIDAAWAALELIGRTEIEAEGVPAADIALTRSADVRYVGEGYEVSVTIPVGLTGEAAVNHMWAEFHRVHNHTFGFEYEGEQDVEVVNLRVQAIGRVNRPDVSTWEGGATASEPHESRQVFWRDAGWVDCPIYRRSDLQVGTVLSGPLIVEEYGSTLVVPKSWQVDTDKYGNLVMRKTS